MPAMSEKSFYAFGIAIGISFIVLGIFAISMPLFTTLLVQQFIGFLLLFASIFHGVNTFQMRGAWNVVSQLLMALVCFAAGYYLLAFPIRGALTLTTFLAAFFLVKGMFKTLEAIGMRGVKGWGWILMEGFSSLVVAYLILSGFPDSAVWAVGLIVGIDLIISGISAINLTTFTKNYFTPA